MNLCAAADGLLAVRRWYSLVAVRGGSMLPTLRPGDRALVRRVVAGRIQVGDVVLCRHYLATGPQPDESRDSQPDFQRRLVPAWVVKRVAAVPGDRVPELGIPEPAQVVSTGSVVLLGDNPAVSEDFRQAGFFQLEQIRGKVIHHLRR